MKSGSSRWIPGTGSPRFWVLLWQVPLAFLSLLLHRSIRGFLAQIGSRLRLRKRAREKRPLCWRGLGEAVKRPLALPYIMATAPRWNAHAVVALFGPVTVAQYVSVDLEPAWRSALYWTIVLYKRNRETTAWVSSHTVPRSLRKWRIDVPPGTYMMTLRYYESAAEVVYPGLEMDDSLSFPPRTVSGERAAYEQYLSGLRDARAGLYLFMHYYVSVMVRWAALLPLRWVERELLPAGNPETDFCYGSVRRGARLLVRVPEPVPSEVGIYLTVYRRSSLPFLWEKVTTGHHLSARLAYDGYYLLRIHPCGSGLLPVIEVDLKED